MNSPTPALQDYLKVLLERSADTEPIHSVDIARSLGYSRASISKAMDALREAGYIEKQRYGTITLTRLGREAAMAVKRRNELLTAFMTDVLGVDPARARQDACRMEHAVSPETADRLERYLRDRLQGQGPELP